MIVHTVANMYKQKAKEYGYLRENGGQKTTPKGSHQDHLRYFFSFFSNSYKIMKADLLLYGQVVPNTKPAPLHHVVFMEVRYVEYKKTR